MASISSRSYKMVKSCKRPPDSNQGLGSKKVQNDTEFWKQKKKINWFCNKPLSPQKTNLEGIGDSQIKNLSRNSFPQRESQCSYEKEESVYIKNRPSRKSLPDKEKSDYLYEQLAEISSSTNTDPFATSGDSSYMPSCTEVSTSSSVLEYSPPDFDIYTPLSLINNSKTAAIEDALNNAYYFETEEPNVYENARCNVSSTSEHVSNHFKDETEVLPIISNSFITSHLQEESNSAKYVGSHKSKSQDKVTYNVSSASEDVFHNFNTTVKILPMHNTRLVTTNDLDAERYNGGYVVTQEPELYENGKYNASQTLEDVVNNVGNTTWNLPADGIVNDNLEISDSGEKSWIKFSKQKNFCYFCETDVLNFARHVINNHSTELDVIKLSSLPPKSLQRRRLLTQLRNKGNFLKTGNNCPRRVRRGQIPNTCVLPCDNCFGFFSSKLLYRHRNKCSRKSSTSAQSDGQTMLIRNVRVDERLKCEVFPHMRADKISFEAKSDSLICSFGARYLRIHRERHFATVTSRKMRELSKILIEIKKIEPSIKTFFEALQPKYFDLFIKATQIVASYNPETEVYGAPSFAMNIVNSFKQCCEIGINMVLKGNQLQTVPAAETEAQLRTMNHLFTANWRFEISSQAANNLNLNKWNKITIVPLAADLKLLKNHLVQSANKAIQRLKMDNGDMSSFNILVESIYCRVILLNRKRPGELQRMLVNTYINCGHKKAHYEEFKSVVTPTERVLLNKLKRVVIRGKRGRGVPVLFTEDVQENIEVMLKYRQNFVHKENLFLFAKGKSRSEICGYKVLSKYAKMCGAKNPTSITSTRLRKHLATLTQIFCMSDNDIEQLATFMGHTPGVHRGSYRLPDDVYQTAKLSKLLLLMEKGEAGHYQGKSLQEINLNMEENLLDETKDNDSDVDNDVDLIEAENLVEVQINEEMEKPIVVQETKLQKKNKRRVLIRWTAEQKRIAKNFFQTHIKSSYPPKKNECESLITKYPQVFHNKNWLKLKVFIQNEYARKKQVEDG